MKLVIRLLCLFPLLLFAQQAHPPKVLIVTAHPDDETGAAIAVYKITHDLGGIVDIALITNGEGGYKYSTLAEAIYGKEITNEATGREFLPTIRKQELMNGGKILGIRNYFFFDQKDNKYTLDLQNVISTVWDTVLVKRRLTDIILKEKYDYIFCVLPVPETHAHHRAATIFALRTVLELAPENRPVVLGFAAETAINETAPLFQIDKTTPFGFKGRLNYKIIVNWIIAEHKSQGVMQLYMNGGDLEQYYYFKINNPDKMKPTQEFFDALQRVPYKEKSYDE
jgi:LmbE family N-acetylglucosaminyl deacetylase